MRVDARPSRPPVASQRVALVALMIVSLLGVATLAVWDEEREAAAALRAFRDEQSTLAAVAAAELTTQLTLVRRDARIVAEDVLVGRRTVPSVASNYQSIVVRGAAEPPARANDPGVYVVSVPIDDARRVDLAVPMAYFLAGVGRLERGDTLRLLILPPGAGAPLRRTDGRPADAPAVARALADGHASRELTRAEAARLGLLPRIAIAGLATTDAGSLGRWGVAVVASAGPERDLAARARRRLILGLILASGLVLAFGGLALRLQRNELELERELSLAGLRREREEQLERESRAATMLTLAAGVAHEVASPLGAIVGRAEQLLERVGEDARARRGVEVILEQSNRIHEVIRGLLKLARGDVVSPAEVEPSAILAGATALVEHRFATAGVRLEVAPADDLPALRGDPTLLEHAVVNLLLNACDASDPGGFVRLAARVDGDAVVFVVDDEGVGISPEVAARATEPFFTTKPPEQGTGLGLAVASEIVKMHRGTLALVARRPRGTRASVRIPIAGEV